MSTQNRHKYIVCLGDGMADEACDALQGKTPLQAADIPFIDRFAQKGVTGLVHTVPEGCHPGSDVANMGILGYDPRDYYTGRGPIEAVAMGIEVPDGQLVFRCNLVCLAREDGCLFEGAIDFKQAYMKSFTADHISTEEADRLLQDLQSFLSEEEAQFFTGVSYRHIVLLPLLFKHLTCAAPHDFTDQAIFSALPQGDRFQDMSVFIQKCSDFLINHDVNQTRIAAGQLPANSIWPWSQGLIPSLPSFEAKFGKTGGIVTAVDLLKGLAFLTGLKAPVVEGATGFLDTHYPNKVAAALDILESHDFVYLHIEAPDEAGHLGDALLKKKAIEDFDRHVVGSIWHYVHDHPETSVLILPDHPTPCKYKTHTSAAVPFVMYQPGKPADGSFVYNEFDVSDLTYQDSWTLMHDFLFV